MSENDLMDQVTPVTPAGDIQEQVPSSEEKEEKVGEVQFSNADEKSAHKGEKAGRLRSWSDSLNGQKKWLSRLLSFLLALVVTIPLFCLFHRIIPNPEWSFPIDRIFIFIAIDVGTYILFRKIRFFMLTLTVLFFGTLVVTSLIGAYSFKDVLMDYRGIIYSIRDEERSVKDIFTKRPFPKQKQILQATRITPAVKQYANKASLANFRKKTKNNSQYRQYIQCFSVFKEIKGKWQYVNDPHKWDYIASADETLQSFAGDCDDYAVLMAACLNAVGGTVRLVRTEDHIYPELRINNKADFDNLSYLIRTQLFKREINKKKPLHYHVDDQGYIWLNMDYTANYPGGSFYPGEAIAFLLIP